MCELAIRTATFQSLMWPVDDISVPPVVITWLCCDTISARTVVGHSLLLARLPGTHWVTICVIQRLALTVSDVFSRLVCFQSTSTPSALEVLHSMRYINLQFTYLLTYFSFVDQSSPRRLENFAEDIPTSPDIIKAHQLNFKPNFKFSRLKFFWGNPVPFGGWAR